MTSDFLLLANGQIADGSGGPLYNADILIQGDSIRQIQPHLDQTGKQVLDCSGLVVAPGFIDAHSHSDLQVLSNKREKVLQGVTSEVVGNCGFSPYPDRRPDELREFANGILYGGDHWGWPSASEYLLEVHSKARLASVASLIGHGSLRIAHAGLQQGPLPDSVVDAMENTLDQALAEGAVGFSTGLMYAPGSSAPKEELERLCQVVATRGKLYCSHIRDYSTNLIEAIDEQIELASTTGCRLQISHLQTVGRPNWKLNAIALERIEAARHSGIDVMFDCYPYVAGSTVLTQLLPQWTLEGGMSHLMERLQNATSRKRIADETLSAMVHEWSDIFISGVGSEQNADAVGKSLEELSRERGSHPIDIVFQLLQQENGAVNMIQFNQSEENLRANLTHPLAIVISDGFYVKGKPHPRLHGTFPELLGNVCRNLKWLSLTEAICKVTALPAERFGLARRGRLKEGFVADVTVFDSETITSRSTYKDPQASPQGVKYVIRNGQQLLSNE